MIRINLVAERKPGKAPAVAAVAAAPGALQFYMFLFLFGGGAAAASGFGWWWMSSQIKNLETEIQTLQKRQAELQQIKRKVDELEAKRKQFKDKVDLINRLKLEQALPVHMLDEISWALPDFVWLTAMDQRGSQVTLDGETNSLTAVANFIAGLLARGDPVCAKAPPPDRPPERTLCYFPTVELVSSTMQPSGVVQFRLTAVVRSPEVAAKELAERAGTAPPAATSAAPVRR